MGIKRETTEKHMAEGVAVMAPAVTLVTVASRRFRSVAVL